MSSLSSAFFLSKIERAACRAQLFNLKRGTPNRRYGRCEQTSRDKIAFPNVYTISRLKLPFSVEINPQSVAEICVFLCVVRQHSLTARLRKRNAITVELVRSIHADSREASGRDLAKQLAAELAGSSAAELMAALATPLATEQCATGRARWQVPFLSIRRASYIASCTWNAD